MKHFNLKRFSGLIKATFFENKVQVISILGIYAFGMTLCTINIFLGVARTEIQNWDISMYSLTKEMTQGLDADISSIFIPLAVFSLFVIVGMVVANQIKQIRDKRKLNIKTILPATACEKFCAFFATSYILPVLAVTATLTLTYQLSKAIIWVTYAASINLTELFDKKLDGDITASQFDTIWTVLIFGLILSATQIIISIYNVNDKHGYTKYLRVLFVLIIGFGLIKLNEIGEETMNTLIYTLFPAVAAGLWVWSYMLFKKKEIRN